MIATDEAHSASKLLRVLAEGDLLLRNTTMSTTAGRLFMLATAEADRQETVERVENSLNEALPGVHALVVDLGESVEAKSYRSLVRLLASGQNRPRMLYDIANAICAQPASSGSKHPPNNIRYLSSVSVPTAGLPGTCVTDAVIDIPELEGMTDANASTQLGALAGSIIDQVADLAKVGLTKMGSTVSGQATRAMSPLWGSCLGTEYSLLVIGADRCGLVRDVAEGLAAIDASIADSWMIAMHDRFLMAYMCQMPGSPVGNPDFADLGVVTSWKRPPPVGEAEGGRPGLLVAWGENDRCGIAAFLAAAIEDGGRRVTDLTARADSKRGWRVLIETRGRERIDARSLLSGYADQFGEVIQLELAEVS